MNYTQVRKEIEKEIKEAKEKLIPTAEDIVNKLKN